MEREPASALTVAGGRLCSGSKHGPDSGSAQPVGVEPGRAGLHKPACVGGEGSAEEACEGPPFLDAAGPAWRCLRRVDSHRPGRWIDSGATSGCVISLSLHLSVKMISYQVSFMKGRFAKLCNLPGGHSSVFSVEEDDNTQMISEYHQILSDCPFCYEIH